MSQEARTYVHGAICAVYGCKNYKFQKDPKSFFRMPRDLERLKKWIVACKRSDLDYLLKVKDADYFNKSYVVCSDHFDIECFRNKDLYSQGLLRDSVPTLNLYNGIQPLKKKSRCKNRIVECDNATRVAKAVSPGELKECKICSMRNVDLTSHDCSRDKIYVNTSINDKETFEIPVHMENNFLFCAGPTCSEIYNSPKKFDLHVEERHKRNMEVLFFPNAMEFYQWKASLENAISIRFVPSLEDTNGRKFFVCVNTKTTEVFLERCPATIVVQKFPKGVLVKYYTQHYRHHDADYKIPKRYQMYRITDYMPPTDDDGGYDPYLDFKILLENIVNGAAKVSINGLKELVARALEMTLVLNTYDQQKDISTKRKQMKNHMTDDEITNVLLDPHFEVPNKDLTDIAPKIINTFSLAPKTPVGSDTDSMDDIHTKILINNVKNPKRKRKDSLIAQLDDWNDKEFASFNESYRDFVKDKDETQIRKYSRRVPKRNFKHGHISANTDISLAVNSDHNNVGSIDTVNNATNQVGSNNPIISKGTGCDSNAGRVKQPVDRPVNNKQSNKKYNACNEITTVKSEAGSSSIKKEITDDTDERTNALGESDVELDSDTEKIHIFDKNKRKETHMKENPKNIDDQYEVIEQDSDCNILVLKL